MQLLLLVLVVLGVYLTSHHLRNIALDHMRSHAQTQTHTKEDRLTQSLNLLQMHLRALISEHPEAATDRQALHNSLIGLQRKLLYIRSLSVMDVDGRVVLSTQKANEQVVLDLGRMLPEVPPHTPDLLRLGAPWQGRDFSTGQRLTPNTADGQRLAGFFPVTMVLPDAPQWTLVIAINSDYFINLAPEHNAPGELAFRAFLDDGTLLFSTSEYDSSGSQPLAAGQIEEVLLLHVGSTSWEDEKGVLQLAAFRASRHYPLFVQSQVSSDFILKKWRADTRQLWLASAVTLAIMLLISGLLTVRVRRSLQREARSLEENRLAASVFMYSSDFIVIADADKSVFKDLSRLRESEATIHKLSMAIEQSPSSIVMTTPAATIEYANPEFLKSSGYSQEEVLGKDPKLLGAENRNDSAHQTMWQVLETDGVWQGEFWNRHKDGSLYVVSSSVNLLRDDAGNITHYISVFSDITVEKPHQESLQKQAHFDLLTGLPNRALMHERLEQAMIRSRVQNHWFAVCFMGLDGFKQVNDSLGHAAGDELLIIIADRLQRCVRGNDTVARMGGDEFVFILSPVSCLEECERIAQRIL